MGTINRFEDLEIWQQARKLSQEVISISKTTELKNDPGLLHQIKDASGSVMDNIAEGFDRDGNKEFRQFLSFAKGSSAEARSQVYRLLDNGYISTEKAKELIQSYFELNKRIGNFISYLNKSEIKGSKFKTKQ